MAEISKTESSGLAAVVPRVSRAENLLSLTREAGGNPPRSVDIDGVGIRADRVAVAASARFSAQIETLREAASNAVEAASVLDVADAALTSIGTKLLRLEELADTGARTVITRDDGSVYTPPELSAQERAILSAEFDDLRSEIDSLASGASFNGQKLLEGDPDTPASSLELSFTLGVVPRSTITASLNAADTASLSSDLASTSLTTQAGADTAVTAVDEAKLALADIQAAVRGARAQVSSVEAAAGEVSAIVDRVRAIKASPEAAVDVARVLADKIVEDGGVRLADGAQQVLQMTLMRASAVATPGGAPPSGSDGIETFGGKTAGAPALAPAPAPSAPSTAGSDTDKA